MDQRSPEILYVALGGEGIYKTTDGGGTWTLINEGLGGTGVVAQIRLDPVSSSRLYVTGAGKLYRSGDSGATWQVVREGVEGLLWIVRFPFPAPTTKARRDAGSAHSGLSFRSAQKPQNSRESS